MDWNSLRLTMLRLYRAHIPNLAVLFLFPVSCWSTFSGLRELMRSTVALSDLEGLLVAAALTLGIQLTLLFAVNTLTRVGASRKPFYFGIYVITVFFSVLFGYSFYFQHLRADEYAREVHEQESRRLLDEGLEYGAQFESLSRSLAALAAYSELRSEEENSRGGTCGDNSDTGRGPRARGRAQDARIFSTYQAQMDELLATEKESYSLLSEDVKAYQASQVALHQANLVRFYESLQQRQKRAGQLLSEVQSYVHTRFPDGSYVIGEGGTSYPCPDARLDQLAGLVAAASVPPSPLPPGRFLAQNSKVVVQHAFEGLTGWMTGFDSDRIESVAVGITSTIPRRADALPLLLGLLVDGLILLAALASHRSGAGRGLIEELHWLETTPSRLRHRFRKQLALLLGCRPEQALVESVRLIGRFLVSERSRTRSGLSHSRVVALPQSGAFLDEYSEISRLRDLMTLLESLTAAKRVRVVRWSDLPGPLPSGLALLRKEQQDIQDEALEIFQLNHSVLSDLTREAFSGPDLVAFEQNPESGSEPAPGLGYDAV